MTIMDADELVRARQWDLIQQAERARLAALLPHQPSAVRRELALACYRLATWLDDPGRYLRPPESGPGDWVAPCASV